MCFYLLYGVCVREAHGSVKDYCLVLLMILVTGRLVDRDEIQEKDHNGATLLPTIVALFTHVTLPIKIFVKWTYITQTLCHLYKPRSKSPGFSTYSHEHIEIFKKEFRRDLITGLCEEALSDLWKALLNGNQSLFYTTLDWFRTIRINSNISVK